MREIEPITRFRRDYKHEKIGEHAKHIDRWIADVANVLAAAGRGSAASRRGGYAYRIGAELQCGGGDDFKVVPVRPPNSVHRVV